MSYSSSLTNQEWLIIEPFIEQGIMGRPRKHSIRDIIDAIMYVLRGGIQWRMLPKDFPPWKTVYDYFFRWKKNGKWDEIHDELRKKCRIKAGKEESPTAAIVDSQSVRTVQKGGKEAMMQARKRRVANVI
jgi:putative transposase